MDEQTIVRYRKEAEQGYADAQFNLGKLYEYGKGVSRSDKQAVYWYRKAAEQGHVNAQAKLGAMYHTGMGVQKDYNLAFVWFLKAADQGHSFALNMVLWMNEDCRYDPSIVKDYQQQPLENLPI